MERVAASSSHGRHLLSTPPWRPHPTVKAPGVTPCIRCDTPGGVLHAVQYNTTSRLKPASGTSRASRYIPLPLFETGTVAVMWCTVTILRWHNALTLLHNTAM